MLNRENTEKCRRILNRYGYRPQMMMVIEECSELQKAACKLLRKSTSATLTNDDTPAVLMANLSIEEINAMAQAKLDRVLGKAE